MHSQVKVELSDDIREILCPKGASQIRPTKLGYKQNGRIANLLYRPTLSYDMKVLEVGEQVGRAREYVKERRNRVSKYWIADTFLYCSYYDLADLMQDIFNNIEELRPVPIGHHPQYV